VLLLLASLFCLCLLPATYGSRFLILREHFSCIWQRLLGLRLRLMLQLLAVAKLILCLPVVVVPLGLAVVWKLQASQDPPAKGGGVQVTVAGVAI
jgi:hypothetical protein